MNKLVKGAVAGAAGIALLIGGAGTFALWNDSAQVDASTISSGTLTLTAGTDGVWKNVTNGGTATIDPSTFTIVPGNRLQFTQTLTIAATGNDLKAELSYNDLAITGSLSGVATTSLAVTSSSANVVPGTAPKTFIVTPAGSSATVSVVLTVELPASTSGTTGQGGTLDLSALTFTLTQKTIGS